MRFWIFAGGKISISDFVPTRETVKNNVEKYLFLKELTVVLEKKISKVFFKIFFLDRTKKNCFHIAFVVSEKIFKKKL